MTENNLYLQSQNPSSQSKHHRVKVSKDRIRTVTEQEMNALQIEAASMFLIQKVQLNQNISSKQIIFESNEVFTLQRIHDLISAFLKCFQLQVEFQIIALVYVQRFLVYNPDLQLTYTNMRNLLLLSLTAAAKFHNDCFEKKTIFSALCNIPRRVFRTLFDTYLDLLQFDLMVSEDEFNSQFSKIKTLVAQKYIQQGLVVVLEKNIRRRTSEQTQSTDIAEPQLKIQVAQKLTATPLASSQNKLKYSKDEVTGRTSTPKASSDGGGHESDIKSDGEEMFLHLKHNINKKLDQDSKVPAQRKPKKQGAFGCHIF